MYGKVPRIGRLVEKDQGFVMKHSVSSYTPITSRKFNIIISIAYTHRRMARVGPSEVVAADVHVGQQFVQHAPSAVHHAAHDGGGDLGTEGHTTHTRDQSLLCDVHRQQLSHDWYGYFHFPALDIEIERVLLVGWLCGMMLRVR